MIVDALFQQYTLGYPAQVLTTGLSPRQVGEVQVQFVRRLQSTLGPVVGYKAALTSAAAQQRFGVSQPLYGFLLQDMLLESGATLPANFGARPVAEGDLIVRVGSADINTAQTDQELLAGLDAVIPFLELPDLVYQDSARVDAAALVAVNVGARAGVMGRPIAMAPTAAWFTRLGQIQVQLVNGRGQTIASGSSQALLGHPLNVVRWLRDTLQSQGVDLRPGDLLSLGSITAPMPVEGETSLRARYFGFETERSVDVTVNFDE
jgi:2-keto-4-pentenoate hydratase